MKLVATIALFVCIPVGAATADDAQDFADGLQRGMQQSNEIACAPGSECFAKLSPEVQKQRYCEFHPSLSCLQSRHDSGSTSISTEAGAVSHVYLNGVYVTCIGTGTGANCS